ncbi:MAG: energy transducer TonB, partial [Pseudoxanthomonas sp.]
MSNRFLSIPLFAFGAMLSATALLSGCGAEQPLPVPVVPSTQVAAVNTPMPHYPAELGCAGIGGMVMLDMTIATDGKPTNVQLLGSSGQAALDKSALEGVKSWQFEPATRGGKPVVQSIRVPV